MLRCIYIFYLLLISVVDALRVGPGGTYRRQIVPTKKLVLLLLIVIEQLGKLLRVSRLISFG